MSATALTAIRQGSRHRLISHYGSEVTGWLNAAPDLITEAAWRWNLIPTGYHDAGHASLIATATAADRRRFLLKAWPEAARFHKETAALRLWASGPAVEVIATAEDLHVAVLEQVGPQPGGGPRPEREADPVARTIHEIHRIGRTGGKLDGFGSLDDYIHGEIRPRIGRRRPFAHEHGFDTQWDLGTGALHHAEQRSDRTTLLHADLYWENVLFDDAGHPVLIDPLPTVGDTVFDWAFWTVYYTLGHGNTERFALATRISGIDAGELLPWCLLLCLDGLLYYLEVGDARAPLIAEVMLLLSAEGDNR